MYKPLESNAIENHLKTKKIKPKHDKLTSLVNAKKFDRGVTAKGNPNQYETHKTARRENQRETTKDEIVVYSVRINN